MLVPIDSMKLALGLATTADPVVDPIMTRSSILAQTLVSAYVGYPVETPEDPVSFSGDNICDVRAILLPVYPAQLVSFVIENVAVPSDQYRFDMRTGSVTFYVPKLRVKHFVIQYLPGFDGELLPVPEDLLAAIQNIALGLYARGGNLQQTGASGALKSLTMFDAMSMSFDVGATTADSSTPEGMVKQWAFVLDQYKVDKYVMR